MHRYIDAANILDYLKKKIICWFDEILKIMCFLLQRRKGLKKKNDEAPFQLRLPPASVSVTVVRAPNCVFFTSTWLSTTFFYYLLQAKSHRYLRAVIFTSRLRLMRLFSHHLEISN